jgi:hypothetical protein
MRTMMRSLRGSARQRATAPSPGVASAGPDRAPASTEIPAVPSPPAHPIRAGRLEVIDQCPASSRWQIFDLGEAGDQRVGQAQMDVEGRLQASASWVHGVVLDAVVLGAGDQVPGVGDLFEEVLFVLPRAEAALA